MTERLIGYARVSTQGQDVTTQREALAGLGVPAERIYVDEGLTGTNRDRPGLALALAACREGDTLIVTKLDRLARSIPDASAIAEELCSRGVRLSLGGLVYDPSDPMGKVLFHVLALVAEFEVDLLRMRTREGMAVAKARGRLRGKGPKLSAAKEELLVEQVRKGTRSIKELEVMFDVTRSTIYRACARARAREQAQAE